MKIKQVVFVILALLLLGSPFLLNRFWGVQRVATPEGRSEDRFFVRAVAMPGNNLQSKLFLSTTGGDPPDLINQDDPVMASWATSGVIQPMSSVAEPAEVEAVAKFLYPAARKLSTFDQQLYGVCNGLDIRALYFNQTALDRFGCQVPQTISELDNVSQQIVPDGLDADRDFYAYLPDSRRLWAWGYVFGGAFVDPDGAVDLASPEIVAGQDVSAATDRIGFGARTLRDADGWTMANAGYSCVQRETSCQWSPADRVWCCFATGARRWSAQWGLGEWKRFYDSNRRQ